MLNALHKKAAKLGLKPNAWQGYAQELSCNRHYPLIFIPSGSFCLITELDKIMATLNLFYTHLANGGIFLFEVESEYKTSFHESWNSSKWLCPNGETIIFSSYSSMNADICSAIGKYELIVNNSVIKTEVEEYKIKIYNLDNLIEILKQIGFKQVKLMKAFNRQSSPNKNDGSIVCECRKSS